MTLNNWELIGKPLSCSTCNGFRPLDRLLPMGKGLCCIDGQPTEGHQGCAEWHEKEDNSAQQMQKI